MARKFILSKAFLMECRARLLESKSDILNRIENSRSTLSQNEGRSGDSGDISSRLITESQCLTFQRQWRQQLIEIENALARIDAGTYGLCEETEELIEPSRLKALPWTRFSVEGAELRDRRN
jgi:DnaK suppressor protein